MACLNDLFILIRGLFILIVHILHLASVKHSWTTFLFVLIVSLENYEKLEMFLVFCYLFGLFASFFYKGDIISSQG